ncbi:MAG: phosphoadenylyl-sulfate reductase [Pseudomonadota bacterium]
MLTVEDFNSHWGSLTPRQRISHLCQVERVTFSTSFGLEDQYLSYLIADSTIDIDIFTLDTGRIFSETYQLWRQTEDEYGIKIRGYYPERHDLQDYEEQYGINGFYGSVEGRQACCKIRKIIPLLNAIQGYDYWISGLRRAQSDNRKDLPFAEYDASNDIIKLYPLADVSDAALERVIATHQIPVNPLHEKGYASIGCAPCTRAIKKGEHPRAGRWWWEQGAQECGLHFVRGKMVRSKDFA